MSISFKTINVALLALGMAAFAATAQAEYTDDCITFSSTASFTLETANTSKNWDGTLWTSTDKTNWIEWNGASVSAAQTGGTGAYNLYVRGDTSNTKITGDVYSARWLFAGTAGVVCQGNIETLRGGAGVAPSPTLMANHCYQYMFHDWTSLTSAPTLPATTLSEMCYCGMFFRCSSLESAPVLPAMTLKDYCYYAMFWGCTSLKVMPELPVTTMASGCYMEMFRECTSLTVTPVLPATTLASCCYEGMFHGCTSLTSAPVLPVTTLANLCYAYMFCGCTSLTNAPALPATTLASSCYEDMFNGCTSLTEPPELPATTLAYLCYRRMFQGCTSLISAPTLPATTLEEWCYAGMFNGCTSLADVPELPATTLVYLCYDEMFQNCTSLEVNTAAPGSNWKIPATSTTTMNWGRDMFTGTAGTLQGQPSLNTTYYIRSALPKAPGSKSNPWPIGAGVDDTVNAWTNGTTLVVQGAGKMMDFDAEDSLVPWPVEQIAAVDISGDVTAIGQNAWLGLDKSVKYNGLSSEAAMTMGNGFGGTTQYARTAFREFLVDGASINATVALETAKSLTNEWVEVELKTGEVSVENGRIVIQHESAPQSQGFYLLHPTE